MIAWKVAVTHLTLDNVDLDFPSFGWVGLSDDTATPLTPSENLKIDDHAKGRLADGLTVVLAVKAYLQTASPASHTLVVPAGARLCFPKKQKVSLSGKMDLPAGSKIFWPRDSRHFDPELVQMHTQANDGGLSLWIKEEDAVTLPQGAAMWLDKDSPDVGAP